MSKYVLVSDMTLLYDYHYFPLLDFLPVASSNLVPGFIYRYLKGKISPPTETGELKYAPYSIRKLEAALKMRGLDVAVPHPDFIENFVDEKTEIIAVSTMDPLGLGPLTMSYKILFGSKADPWVKVEWDALMQRLNTVRKGKKAKLVVGGPGIWEFTIRPDMIEKYNIDYAVQGEVDDVVAELFDEITEDRLDKNLFINGYSSFDQDFHRFYVRSERFITRRPNGFPSLDNIPLMVNPSMKSLTEIMRGCGIGCDFCEVTLRPLRYYPVDWIVKEVSVNVRGGYNNAWLHTDEFFAYMHGPKFVPNEDKLVELVQSIMAIDGIRSLNPTHARISPAAAYPELLKKLSKIIGAGPANWIGVQVGIETGSDRLAKLHMPSKALPLSIGADGSWSDIVAEGTKNMNTYYWRPAFTVQVGQESETEDDNWSTVALINRMSNSEVMGRPFEFTVTPMQNVPLGVLKGEEFRELEMNESQLAVYYASYRHLAKMAVRDGFKEGRSGYLSTLINGTLISVGGMAMLRAVEAILKRRNLDLETVKNYMPEEPIIYS